MLPFGEIRILHSGSIARGGRGLFLVAQASQRYTGSGETIWS